MHAKHALYQLSYIPHHVMKQHAMEISGIEPETSCMLSMRSTN
jgi:hypothetical protein